MPNIPQKPSERINEICKENYQQLTRRDAEVLAILDYLDEIHEQTYGK